MRNYFFWFAVAAVFIVPNAMIVQKEMLLKNGKSIFLGLAPRDPRSLMQGDYMILRYDIIRKIPDKERERNGYIVLELTTKNIAKFKRLYKAKLPLAKNEILLAYRYRNRRVRLGAESFFFQEGHAKLYNKARYGELKVTSSGASVLVGLRDSKLNKLGPQKK